MQCNHPVHLLHSTHDLPCGSLVPRPFFATWEKLVWWTAHSVFVPRDCKNYDVMVIGMQYMTSYKVWNYCGTHHRNLSNIFAIFGNINSSKSCQKWQFFDNAILRYFVAKIWGSDRQGTTILERNTSFSDRETLEQPCWQSNCPFTVDKFWTQLDRSWNSWQPSRALVSVLRSVVSGTLPRLLSFLGRHYSRVLRHFHIPAEGARTE